MIIFRWKNTRIKILIILIPLADKTVRKESQNTLQNILRMTMNFSF